jgi:hypothetical protein
MRTVLVSLVGGVVVIGSCIFQNNPLGLNQSPVIRSYSPEWTYDTLTAPDSCVFTLRAVDPDGDAIRYKFTVKDGRTFAQDSFKFYALVPGQYDIRGEAWDGTTRAYHEWHATVIKKNNAPPKIKWFQPEQTEVACAVGDTLEFHFQVDDDDPGALRLLYLLDSKTLTSGSSALIYRFMERGDFLLQGVAWDGQYGDTVSWRVAVTGYPDTTKPAAIMDLSGGPGETSGTIALEWTAPGDDGNSGKASSYIVRTSTYPIRTEKDWDEAEGKPGEPVPSVAGTRERMTIRNLVSASYVYVTMRAVDDFFNMSPLGNCAKVLVRGIDIGGRVLNAATNEPIAGYFVSAGIKTDTSAVDGSYLLENVPSYVTSVDARDEKAIGVIGNYYDCTLPTPVITQFIPMDFRIIPAFGLVNTVPPDIYAGRFLAFFKDITGTSGEMQGSTVFKGWNHWPVTVYNPPREYNGVDLQAEARSAMADWETSTGLDLFAEVPQGETADVIIRYDSTVADRHHVETPAFNPDGTPARREVWIFFLDLEIPMDVAPHLVFAHEFGHVLGFGHSRNTGHLMVGLTTPRVQSPTLDEIRVAQIIYHMPFIFDYFVMKEE